MKVLLAVDSSPESQLGIAAATGRPWPSGTTFQVLTVIDLDRWEGTPTLLDDARRAAELLVKGANEKLSRTRCEMSSEIQWGSPAKAISDHAKEWGADMVMVGSHGQGGSTRFLLGSVSQAVLRMSTCSVEIVRQAAITAPPADGTTILLATDGSEYSAHAVYSVANRPWPANSRIRILSVVQLPIFEQQTIPSSVYSEYPSELLQQMWKEARVRADQAIAEARKILKSASSILCDAMVTPAGRPRAVILDEAQSWGANLIVLGSHGRRGGERLSMGSVAESVALHAHCAVEVIRQ